MEANSQINQLELQLKKNDLTFEEKMELRDKILEAKIESGQTPRYKNTEFKCIGCSG